MPKFYYIYKLKAFVAANSCAELVTGMRECEWKERSTNSDYMHVYAYWKEINSHLKIRFENENDFVADLLRFNEIKQVSKCKYIFLTLFRNHFIFGQERKSYPKFIKIHYKLKHKKAV